jgi:PilZ domain
MDASTERFPRDNRSTPRHDFRGTLRVRIWKSRLPELSAKSINVSVSERGIFFVTDKPFQKGAVEVLLRMPQEVTGEPPTEWRCTGLVVHVRWIDTASGKHGVGVRFDCYEVARTRAEWLE